jgi:hypothetical protein
MRYQKNLNAEFRHNNLLTIPSSNSHSDALEHLHKALGSRWSERLAVRSTGHCYRALQLVRSETWLGVLGDPNSGLRIRELGTRMAFRVLKDFSYFFIVIGTGGTDVQQGLGAPRWRGEVRSEIRLCYF